MVNSIFSLTPTFTQGLILGQLSIIVLLGLILKYLFLDSHPEFPYAPTAYSPTIIDDTEHIPRSNDWGTYNAFNHQESAEWFNVLLQQIVETYRSKLRDDLAGAIGDEVARDRIERFANGVRPQFLVDPIKILSVDLGSCAPRISNTRLRPRDNSLDAVQQIEFDMEYMDSISVSLSTSVLFNYPVPYFARLPVSLTVSLAYFSSTVFLTPPDPSSPNPTLSLCLSPNFNLQLKTSSLMGSRAKLADVPKLHEMIQDQVRRLLADRGTWKVVMPWVANVDQVREGVGGK
ncbi:maintenance of mitochondrial morphology protein 1 [Rickenella mellea]|uniref:Maintenance of mitochondrial morphology protein 1 n=1 Tax=Rickenella mellea TaxID=50990 RepID=A0A4Y7QNH6_9AGAM|nr:maintenance of mitochondrial morphology protein 1 [Rickenella mellea]